MWIFPSIAQITLHTVCILLIYILEIYSHSFIILCVILSVLHCRDSDKADAPKQSIQLNDILHLPPSLTSKEVFKEFVALWGTSQVETKKTPGLWNVLYDLIFVDFWIAGLYRLMSDLLVLFNALVLKQFVMAAGANDQFRMFILSCVFLTGLLSQAICIQQFIHGSFMCGSKVVSAATSAVFHSSLVLRLHKMYPTKTVGEINNLIAKDTFSLREFVVFAHNLWCCPLTIVIGVAMIVYLLGYAGIVSCVLMPMMLPLENYLVDKSRTARKAILKCSDLRLQLINQMIDGMRTIKLTGLADFVRSKVSTLRDNELKAAWSNRMIEVINITITRSVTMLVTFCTFAAYIWFSDVPLTADKAFAALAVINVLGRPMQVIPNSVSKYSNACVSVARLERMIYDALEFNSTLFSYSSDSGSLLGGNSLSAASVRKSPSLGSGSSLPALTPSYYGLALKNVTAMRPPQTSVLRNVSLSITSPGLTIVAGKNGSGKTALLLTVLEEMLINNVVSPAMSSSNTVVSLGGSVLTFPQNLAIAYCGHDPWIINATARQNILLGRCLSFKHLDNSKLHGGEFSQGMMSSETLREMEESVDEEVYASAVAACALTVDFEAWNDGDNTVIGERGMTISGGQKHRLALARAIYSRAKIVCLDSSLSALDAVVSSHVFSQAILTMAKDRIVLMVTHQPHYFAAAQRIVLLDDGLINFDGDYGDLLHSELDLSECLVDTESKGNVRLDDLDTKKKSAMNTLTNSPAVKADKRDGKQGGKAANLDTLENSPSSPAAGSSNSSSVYWQYAQACGVGVLFTAMGLSAVAYGSNALSDYQLALWTDGTLGPNQYLFRYSVLLAAVVALHFTRLSFFMYSGYKGSKRLHERLLDAVLRSRFSFFDTTPSGRITARFSIDFDTIDFDIPVAIASCTEAVLGIITGVAVVVTQSPVYIVLLIPLVYKYSVYRHQYRAPSKTLKAMDSSTKAPVFSHFKETLEGLECIRGYKIQQTVIERHHELLDRSICTRLNWDAVNRWLGIRLDVIGALLVSFAAFSVAITGAASAGTAGLLLNYAFRATNSLSFAIRASTALENQFVSPERVLQYIGNEPEDNTGGDSSSSSASSYSSLPAAAAGVEMLSTTTAQAKGEVVLTTSDLCAQYSPTLPRILDNVSLSLKKGELVGICGRTGCGKSTLSLALAGGITEVTGSVTLSGKTIGQYPSLNEYRRSLMVFPQDSYVLEGTVREVVDPDHIHQDMTINSLLELLSAALPSAGAATNNGAKSVDALNLNFHVTAGGANLSAGQKQLIVLLRAALSSSAKVLVLDELFSNLDVGAAKRAMNVITKELIEKHGVSVILIAHSLQDLALCHSVWVMDKGKVVEQGRPIELLESAGSRFYSMICEMGGNDMVAQLKRLILS